MKNYKDRELLFSLTKKDFDVQTFRGGGPGGQHQNKTDSAVRIIHRESGATGECRENKSQHRNKTIAFKRLTESNKFKIYINRRAWAIIQNDTKTIDQKVEESMHHDNLKIELRDDRGRWRELTIVQKAIFIQGHDVKFHDDK